MSKFFRTDKAIILDYLLIYVISLGLSCFSLFANTEFNYYPIVITAIAFAFGFGYLIFMLKAGNKQIDASKTQQPSTVSFMALNLVRFLIVVASIGASLLFIYFGPRRGEIEKWVYLLILIDGLPLLVSIFLFYMRGHFSE